MGLLKKLILKLENAKIIAKVKISDILAEFSIFKFPIYNFQWPKKFFFTHKLSQHIKIVVTRFDNWLGEGGQLTVTNMSKYWSLRKVLPPNHRWPGASRVGESLGSGAETTQPDPYGMMGAAPDVGPGFDETANPTGAS